MSTESPPIILVVEDNPINLELIVELLEFEGYTVLSANSGETSIPLAQQEQPDLILMDVSLPGMSGLETVRALRAAPRTQTIPIVAVTANALPADQEAAREAGCSTFIAKPIDIETLLKIIKELVLW